MQGEYRGDFTRDTFDPKKRFRRVLYQQGRVQLDADFNEQAAILLYYLQSLAKDLFGEYGGPCDSGFLINPTAPESNDFDIVPRHYYIDGILCEANPGLLSYAAGLSCCAGKSFRGYIPGLPRCWERHITYIDDDGIREVALGGPDTATRAKVVSQIKAWDINGTTTFTDALWNELQKKWQPTNRGRLK